MGSSRLRKYLTVRAAGGFGWVARYDQEIMASHADDPHRFSYLAGHYSGLLDDVLRLLGDGRITTLASVSDDIDGRLRRLEGEADGGVT